MNNNNERDFQILTKIAELESEIRNIKSWNEHQNERVNKLEDKLEAKTGKLGEKIDKIIENEKQLIETINNSGSSLDDKIDERFNSLQRWLLGTAATAGLGLLMFILENVLK